MADDIPNRAPQLLGVNYFFAVLAFLTVLLRCYVRIFIVKRFSFDDLMMVVAMIIFEAYVAFSNAGAYNGTGKHHSDLEDYQIKTAMRWWWFCYLAYAMSMMASKISIGIFLHRIVFSRLHKWIIYIAMLVSVIAGFTFFFVTLFQCNPVSYFWNEDQPGGCINGTIVVVLAIVYSVFAIASDLTFVILPMYLVWNLNIKKKDKLALIPLLCMGCIASAAVVVRFPYLLDLNSPDFLWDTLDTAIWSTTEQGLAISAGSLATTRPLFRMVAARFGWTSSAYPSAYPSNADDLNMPPIQSRIIQSKSHTVSRQDRSPTPNEGLRDDVYGYRVSIEAAGDSPPTSGGDIVVTTHRMQMGHRNESEEWLAKSDRKESR